MSLTTNPRLERSLLPHRGLPTPTPTATTPIRITKDHEILRAAPQAHFLRHEEAATYWTAEDAGETKIMGFAIGKTVAGLVASLQQLDVGEEGSCPRTQLKVGDSGVFVINLPSSFRQPAHDHRGEL